MKFHMLLLYIVAGIHDIKYLIPISHLGKWEYFSVGIKRNIIIITSVNLDFTQLTQTFGKIISSFL